MKIVNENEFKELIKDGYTVVDFYADWCGPCKSLGPILEEVSKTYTDVKFIKVNVDDNENLAYTYGIMSIPCVIMFKDNELVNKFIGLRGKEEVESFIESNIKEAVKKPINKF